MPAIFQIVIIRKDGADGGKLPLDVGEYTFGRYEKSRPRHPPHSILCFSSSSDMNCQVRLKPEYVTGIEDIHAKIHVSQAKQATLSNVSSDASSVKLKVKENGTDVEKDVGKEPVPLPAGAVITICTRSFRFEPAPQEAPNGKSKRKSDGEPKPKKKKRSSDEGASPRTRHPSGLTKWTSASLQVLKREGKPLPVKDIANLAIKYGYVTEYGQTPGNSITAELHKDIKRPDSPFKKFGPGLFGLKEMDEASK